MKQHLFVISALCLALLSAGCGEDPAVKDRPATHPTTITVMHKGSPVEGATVTLVPQDAEKGKAAFGMTGADGTVKVRTFEEGDGAVAGEYTVTVVKIEAPPAAPQVDQDDPNYDPNPPAQTKPPKHLLPEKYSKPVQSDLKITIKEGENTQTFTLE